MAAFVLTGCMPEPCKEEKEKARAFVEQNKDKITDYIKQTFGEKSKITRMELGYTIKQDVIWFGEGKAYADGFVITRVKLGDEKFNVLNISRNDTYYTDKNEDIIKQSFHDYVVNVMGSDKIIYCNMEYGIGRIYFGYSNFVDSSIVSYEQLYDSKHIVDMYCFLKDTDLVELKDSKTFADIEKLVYIHAKEYNRGDVVFINIEEDIEENELKKNYYSYFQTHYVDIGSESFSVPITDYTYEHPNHAYSIGR